MSRTQHADGPRRKYDCLSCGICLMRCALKRAAQDEAEFVRSTIESGIDERRAEVEEPCDEPGCPRASEWFYPTGAERQYCDVHVPRGGCYCNINEDGVEDRDDLGRLLPCVDWMYFAVGQDGWGAE